MSKYYYFGAALPDISMEYPPDISLEDFKILSEENLSDRDEKGFATYRRIYDIENLLAYWKKEPLDPRGNYDLNELEDAIVTREGFPGYIYDYLDEYDSTEDLIVHYSELTASYFSHELERNKGFLAALLLFEREWRLVFAGFRAKEQGRDLAKELQYEDPDDDLVAQILAQKDAKHYEPPERYGDLKELFEEHKGSPLELHKALCEYRFQKIEEMIGLDVYSIDRLLGYLVQLSIVEKWQELDKKKGMALVDTIVKESI